MPSRAQAERRESPRATAPEAERRLSVRSLGASLFLHGGLWIGLIGLSVGLRALRPHSVQSPVAVGFVSAQPPPQLEPEPEESVESLLVDPLEAEPPEASELPLPLPDFEWEERHPLESFETLAIAPGRLDMQLGPLAASEEPPDSAPEAPALLEAAAPLVAQPARSVGIEQPPTPIAEQCPHPEYPPAALRRAESGTVVFLLTVDERGQVAALEIESSSGHEALDRAAHDCLALWHFRPGTRDGRPVEMTVRKQIDFRLPG